MENQVHTENSIKANKVILEDLVKIQDLRSMIAELKEEEERQKKHLAKLIHEAYRIVDKDGNELASWAPVEYNRFDQTSFKEAYPDIYSCYVKTSFEKRLNIYLSKRR